MFARVCVFLVFDREREFAVLQDLNLIKMRMDDWTPMLVEALEGDPAMYPKPNTWAEARAGLLYFFSYNRQLRKIKEGKLRGGVMGLGLAPDVLMKASQGMTTTGLLMLGKPPEGPIGGTTCPKMLSLT